VTDQQTTHHTGEIDQREHATSFDTLRMAKKFENSGFSTPQVEALVDQAVYGYNAVMNSVATKKDLEILELKISAEIAKGVRSVQYAGGFFALVLGLLVTLMRFAG
jgi:hypothetical protein